MDMGGNRERCVTTSGAALGACAAAHGPQRSSQAPNSRTGAAAAKSRCAPGDKGAVFFLLQLEYFQLC